jgi:hypothetical protein
MLANLPPEANAALLGPDELQAAARELAERSAAEQGLPPRVTDHGVLELVARLAGKPTGN